MKSYIVEVEKKSIVISHVFEGITEALAWMEKGFTASLDDDQDGERVKYSIYEYSKEKP